ncbi:MAG: PHP domain-containing protein, partial [Acidobacteriota bacterium]
MRLDTHVHSCYSGPSTIRGLKHLLRESYTTPEALYQLAKRRGMDLVTITDHDSIDGALTIAHRPDVIVGCEVTASFKHDGVQVHLGVLGLNEAQFADINQLRADITELLPYLRQQQLFVSLNHVASRVRGALTAEHIAA